MSFQTNQNTIPLANIAEEGWAMLDLHKEVDLPQWMLKAASCLGDVIPTRKQNALLDRLCVLDEKHAHANSLSKHFGISGLPMHVDTAHWHTPCRFAILGCVEPGDASRRTRLLDWRTLQLHDMVCRQLHTAPFRIANGRQSFYSSILSANRDFIRYDMTCMSPANDEAKAVRDAVTRSIEDTPSIDIKWKTNRVVIFDNWRMLHGRSNSGSIDTTRVLLRALIQ